MFQAVSFPCSERLQLSQLVRQTGQESVDRQDPSFVLHHFIQALFSVEPEVVARSKVWIPPPGTGSAVNITSTRALDRSLCLFCFFPGFKVHVRQVGDTEELIGVHQRCKAQS